MPYKYRIKTIIVGDTGVGKSAFLQRFAHNKFKNDRDSTIGVEFNATVVDIGTIPIKFELWDTAGQERFRSIISGYFRDSIAIILCYDITRVCTFNNLSKWICEIKEKCPYENSVILLGLKNDLTQERKVTTFMGQNLADKYGFLFKEISSKLCYDQEDQSDISSSNGLQSKITECICDLGHDILTKINKNVIIPDITLGVKYGIRQLDLKNNLTSNDIESWKIPCCNIL
jgi:Ras-related protein Rab-2A